MATSAKNKILLKISQALLARDKASSPATTTLSAGVNVGAATFTVTSATGITIGKLIRLGDGETSEPVLVTNVSGTTITPARPIQKKHDSGDAVVEQTLYDMGDVAGTAQLTVNAEVNEMEVETRRLTFALLNGFIDLEAALSLVGLTPWTLAAALGIPFGQIYGTGASGTPYALATDGSEIGTATPQFVFMLGVKMDSTTILLELWAAENDYTGVQVSLGRGQATQIPCKWVGPAAIVDENAVAYVGDTTSRPDKGDLLDSVQEVGIFEAATSGPLSTTLSATAAAGITNPSLTAETNLVAGDWVQINSGDLVEYHQVASTGPVVLKTKLYRAHPSGTPVVRQKQTTLGGIVAGSVQFSIGGSTEKIRLENYRATVGLKPGAASIELAFQIADMAAANIARAAGVPQSDVVSNRLLLAENIATVAPSGVYLRGKNKNLETVHLVAAGCSQAIQNMVVQLAKKGVVGLPYTFRPNSMFLLTVNA